MKHRLTVAAVLAIVPTVLVASVAWAYFISTGTGTGSAPVAPFGAPTAVAGVPSGTDVAVSWTAGAAPGAVGYYVSRTPSPSGAPTDVCGSPGSPLGPAPTSCTDSAVHAGTYTYTVTAVFHTWTATSAASDPVTVARQASVTTLALSSPTATYGAEQLVVATAHVSTGAGIVATGTVTVSSGGHTLCTITLPAATCPAGATSLDASVTPQGVVAAYSGDAEHTGSSSDPQDLTVAPDSTTTTVTALPGTVTVGYEHSVVLTAAVATGNGETLPSADAITIGVGSASCATTLVPVAGGGSGSCSIGASDLAVSGTRYPVTTTYGGDTDLSGSSGTAATGLLVVTTPTITTPSLPGATRTQTGYLQALTVAGGSTPFTWSVSVGTLPAGLTLGAATGRIDGDVGALADTATVTVRAVDRFGAQAQATYTLTVDAAPHITTTSLATAKTGEAGYSQTLVATGGAPDLSWSTSGILPDGLTLDTSTGVISGNVSLAAVTSTFMVTVSDPNGVTDATTLTITVDPVFVRQVTIPRASGSHDTFTVTLQTVGAGDTLVLSLAQPCTDAGTPVLSGVLDANWNSRSFASVASTGCALDTTGDAELWALVDTGSATGATTVTVHLAAAGTVPFLNVTEYAGVTGVDSAPGASAPDAGTGATVTPHTVTPSAAGELVVSSTFVNRATAGTLATQIDPFLALNQTTPFLGFGAFQVDPGTAPLGWSYTQTAPAAWASVTAAFTLAP